MLSRLKGIETSSRSHIPVRLAPGSALDMLSRLKGIETKMCKEGVIRRAWALDMLSRLKGIETNFTGFPHHRGQQRGFGYAFPFEGN